MVVACFHEWYQSLPSKWNASRLPPPFCRSQKKIIQTVVHTIPSTQ